MPSGLYLIVGVSCQPVIATVASVCVVLPSSKLIVPPSDRFAMSEKCLCASGGYYFGGFFKPLSSLQQLPSHAACSSLLLTYLTSRPSE
jgi:hypothetical protein